MDKVRLMQTIKGCEDALKTLEGALLWGLKDDAEIENLSDPQTRVEAELSRDGIILRFEYTFEMAWKLMKELNDFLGTPCYSPKDCIRLSAKNGLIDNPEEWLEYLEYTDNRNLIVHTYGRANTQRISGKIEDFTRDTGVLVHKAKEKVGEVV